MSKVYSVILVATVFGVYSHGKLEGKTNPKAFADVTVYGETVKEAKKKIIAIADGAFYRVKSIVDAKTKASSYHQVSVEEVSNEISTDEPEVVEHSDTIEEAPPIVEMTKTVTDEEVNRVIAEIFPNGVPVEVKKSRKVSKILKKNKAPA